MNLTGNLHDINSISKPQQEQVEQEKQEYYLLGQFIRTRGLRLYGFNHLKNEIFEVNIQYGDTLHLVPRDGKLIAVDFESEKCTVDSRFVYFEALNNKSASIRVQKYKQGKIDQLCNLKKYTPDSLKIF